MYPSSVVIKPEPLLGSVSPMFHPQYHHTDSVMAQQAAGVESSTSGLHSTIEEHQAHQQSTYVPIKQEPPESDCIYSTLGSSVKAEDGQIPVIHEYLSHTNDGIKLEQTGGTDNGTNITMGKMKARLDKVESVECEAHEIRCPPPEMSILKPPVPVALYRHQGEAMTGGQLESLLPVRKDCLGTHIQGTRLHRPTGEKTYYTCGRINKPTRVKRIRKNTDEKPFKCSLCDYKCVSDGNLFTHMRTHFGKEPSTCSVCSYRTTRNSNFEKHMRTHTGVKPFKCSKCDYESVSNSYLKIHMRKHTGEKPFKCSLCDYRSARKDCLVSHMRKHHGEKLL